MIGSLNDNASVFLAVVKDGRYLSNLSRAGLDVSPFHSAAWTADIDEATIWVGVGIMSS